MALVVYATLIFYISVQLTEAVISLKKSIMLAGQGAVVMEIVTWSGFHFMK